MLTALLQWPVRKQLVCLLKHPPPQYTHQGHRMSWPPLVPSVHSAEAAASNRVLHNHFPGSECVGSVVCLHSSQSPAFTGFAGWELTLYKREGVWLYGLRGRVSGYWNQRQGVWLFGGRGRVSGYLELAPLTPLFQLGHCKRIQLMFRPEKGPFVNRKCWGASGVRNLLCCWKEKQKTAT